MKPITTADLSSGVQVAAARTKAALRSSILQDLKANAALSGLTDEQRAAVAEAAAESAMLRIVTAGSASVVINVNLSTVH